MHQVANALDEPSTGGTILKNLTMSNLQRYDKAIIVWCRDLEGSPFVEENVTLDKITSFDGVRLLKVYRDTVNNSYSAPIYQFRKQENEISREFIDYLVHDQTTWEIIDVRVFIKD
jgi:hypothetical protein